VNDRPILSLERILHKDSTHKCSVGKNNGRGTKGAWNQDEVIEGKLPVVN
jgi:hypothetical protein